MSTLGASVQVDAPFPVPLNTLSEEVPMKAVRLAAARGRRAGVGRRGRVGGPPPRGPVPPLAGLVDGNGCSIGTYILSYKPVFPICA